MDSATERRIEEEKCIFHPQLYEYLWPNTNPRKMNLQVYTISSWYFSVWTIIYLCLSSLIKTSDRTKQNTFNHREKRNDNSEMQFFLNVTYISYYLSWMQFIVIWFILLLQLLFVKNMNHSWKLKGTTTCILSLFWITPDELTTFFSELARDLYFWWKSNNPAHNTMFL